MLETFLNLSSWVCSGEVGTSVPGVSVGPGGGLGLKGLNCCQKFVLGVSPGASVPGFSRVNQKKARIARAMMRMINKVLFRLDILLNDYLCPRFHIWGQREQSSVI